MIVAGNMAAIINNQIICIRSLGVTMTSQRNAATTSTARTSIRAFYARQAQSGQTSANHCMFPQAVVNYSLVKVLARRDNPILSPQAHAFSAFSGRWASTESAAACGLLRFWSGRRDAAHGPMSGPHPYTDGASIVDPAPWRFAATTKTGNVDRQSGWPTKRAPDS